MVKHCSHIIYSGLGGHTDYVLTLSESEYLKNTIHFYGVEEVPEQSIAKLKKLSLPYSKTLKQRGIDFKSVKTLIKKLKSDSNKTIFTHQPNLIVWLWLFNIRKKKNFILVEHQNNQLKTRKEWIWTFLSQFIVSRRIYLTEQYKNEVQHKLGIFFRKKKSEVINSGVQNEWFQKKKFSNNEDSLVFGMQSRLVPIKDHLTLIKAFHQYLKNNPNSKLKIAGDGETMSNLNTLVAELNINNSVEFCGMLSNKDLRSFLNSLDVYVHATFGETLSIALMQAQATPLPIIASDVSGINNFMTTGDGILVKLKSKDEMLDALCAMSELNLRKKFHHKSELNSLSLNSDHMIEKYALLV